MPSGSTSPRAESTPARLFVALWPDADARAALAAHRDGWRWPATARPIASCDLHATLHFIGDCPRERIAELQAMLAEVATESPTLRGKALELWRGGIAVLTLQAEPRLLLLHERIGVVLVAAGIARETRPFVPHVTLARRAKGAVAPSEPPAITWHATGLALVQSHGGQAPYEVLQAWSRQSSRDATDAADLDLRAGWPR